MEGAGTSGAAVDADVQKAVRMGIAATEKKDYQTALTLFNHVYGNPAFNAPTEGLSFWGLCVAVHEKQTKKGVELCRRAIEEQFYDSTHHANLVKLHLAKGQRKVAVQAIDEALEKLPNDKRLLELRTEMGYRQSKPVPFLPRGNALNAWLGVRRRGTGSRTRVAKSGGAHAGALDARPLQPMQMILFGFLGFATVFTITFYILYQQAYG